MTKGNHMTGAEWMQHMLDGARILADAVPAQVAVSIVYTEFAGRDLQPSMRAAMTVLRRDGDLDAWAYLCARWPSLEIHEEYGGTIAAVETEQDWRRLASELPLVWAERGDDTCRSGRMS